jgi:D-lactate dehydrogenase
MKLLVFSTKDFEREFLETANRKGHQVSFTRDTLDSHTAIQAVGHQAISIFSGDDASLVVLEKLWDLGVRYITLRSAGYNNIHIKAAKRYGFKVAHTPDFSPHAIAEHTVALVLALNRKIVLADRQVHNYNFMLDDLMGFNLHEKTFGIIGTGRIGFVVAKIMRGFGCTVLANDLEPNHSLTELYNVRYVDKSELFEKSDIVSIHIPLTYENHGLVNKERLGAMKEKAILVNTARGSIVDTRALLEVLENNHLGGYAADVYEKEKGIFFKDNSKTGIADEKLKKLLSFSNVLLTPHQAFVTEEALKNIAESTFYNLDCWEQNIACKNELGYETLIS